MGVALADRQKAKLVVLFSALGLGGFLLNILAGIGLWYYAESKQVEVPTYDRFVGELRVTPPAAMPKLAGAMFERWSACESTRSGMTSVAIHALITSSVVAIAFFTLCLVLGLQVYRKITRMAGGGEAPQPPESVDETWGQHR